MRINLAIPEAHVKAPVLDGALEAVTRLNESLIKAGVSPTSDELLARGAIWKPEPPGDEHFDHGGIIAKRHWGDCDDWAPVHAATLRVTGEDPGARAVVRKSGPKRWHATVIRSDGTEDDPSVKAGMPGPAREIGIRGATLPIMFPRRHGVSGTYVARPQLALRPVADRAGEVEAWQARADLPWHWLPGNSPADTAMASLHASPVSSQAISGAVRGAFRLGVASGQADPEHLRRLAAVADACEGCPYEELVEAYGPEHAQAASQIVGSFFGKAFRRIGKIAKGAVKIVAPLAKGALSFVPGGSVAVQAFNMASPALKRAVMKQSHKPPQLRAPLQVSPLQRLPVSRAAAPAGAPGCPQWLPYPYPLPYPVPGWGSGSGAPGVAWPPEG